MLNPFQFQASRPRRRRRPLSTAAVFKGRRREEIMSECGLSEESLLVCPPLVQLRPTHVTKPERNRFRALTQLHKQTHLQDSSKQDSHHSVLTLKKMQSLEVFFYKKVICLVCSMSCSTLTTLQQLPQTVDYELELLFFASGLLSVMYWRMGISWLNFN